MGGIYNRRTNQKMSTLQCSVLMTWNLYIIFETAIQYATGSVISYYTKFYEDWRGIRKLSDNLRLARWRLFGHIETRTRNTRPGGQASMDYYCETPPKAKMYRGRKRKTLPVVIDEDKTISK